MPHTLAAIGVGSNLGDRIAHVAGAWAALSRVRGSRLVRCSAIIETAAWGPVAQGAYLNAACLLETTLSARELLGTMHEIERAHGRDRSAPVRFGPRTLDLDLVLFGDAVSDQPMLTLPHPRMHERAFVLEPLAAIAPGMVHPTLRKSVAALLAELRGR